MRSRKWLQRIAIVASIALNMAFIDHDVFHRSFVDSLVEGVWVFGGLLLALAIEETRQQRRTRAQQQPANVEERDASGG